MKKLIIATLILLGSLLLALNTFCQLSPTFRAGYNQRMNSPLIAPSINIEAHNLLMQPEMIIYTARNAPVSFGLKVGYTWHGISAGYGKYFDMYTTDKFDINRNGFNDVGFIRYSGEKYFVQADWHRGVELSGGVKINLIQLK